MIYGTLLFFCFLCSSLDNTNALKNYEKAQHALHDYKVNANGRITLAKMTKDTFDRLILVEGKKGKINYNKANNKLRNEHILVKKGVLQKLLPLKGRANKRHYKGMQISFQANFNLAKNVFEFLADHTSVEWSLLSFGIGEQTRNFVYTSYRPDLEFFGSVKVHHLLNYPREISSLRHYHNHPRTPVEALDKYAFPSNSDLDFRNKILEKGIDLVEFMIRTEGKYIDYTDPKKWNKRNGEDWL
ncbi:JAB-like toxin 1 domain-containing protein [Aureispira sp. CCB-E]|uniref:JAB-like toxin 1 domain-containing protein n=1 Tax=Aureispira sp. CCB-E TaxID=3051121 RepID=UPI002868E3E0|nr:JAB-like toxin 1 domain-containing protein [Aureispira sp. CCB-E]WMX15073.1 JAB-like toxin 1 domain-containing protein [Aureispira sp. CCB-E]